METNELIKKVRKIEIKAKGKSADIFSGAYHSAFKGRGMSFSEVRSYQFGDDVRNIDWNVTAKTGEAYVKVFEEERELTIMLLIDVSASLNFGSVATKNDYLAEVAALIAFNAMNNHDRVGAILFDSEIVKYIPPSKGRTTVLRIIREILNTDLRKGNTDLPKALDFLSGVQHKRCITFIFSDFISSNYHKSFQHTRKKHDVIPVKIVDKFEQQLPDVGLLELFDAESGTFAMVDTSSRWVRNKLKKNLEEYNIAFESLMKKTGTGYLTLFTDDDYVKAFLKFFKNR